MTSCAGRSLRASTALAFLFALFLAFAQVAAAQEPGSEPAGDPFSASGLTDSPLAPEGSTSGAGATIASDAPDYAPGSIITLTGSGWQPGESVRIVVNDDGLQEQPWQRDVTVTAGADGTIGDIFDLPMWFVAQYAVTATGEQSGTATTTFTDAIAFGGCPSASIIPVNTTTDEFNNVANGTCSLREAIRTANGDVAADTITLPGGTYTLTIAGPPGDGTGEDNSARGDLDVAQPVTIQGNGARTTIIQAGTTATNGIDRVIDVRDGGLTMSGVTVRNGRIADHGAGIEVRNFPGGSTAAGLVLTDSTVAGNANNLGNNNNDGGGIFSSQTGLTLNRVTVSGNTAGRDGGGISTTAGATMTNVTVTDNTAGGNRTGGGIYSDGATTLTNLTVSHNTVPAGGLGGGLHRQGGTLGLRNTIVANNTASASANCNNGVTNTSNNLDSGTTCGFTTANGSKSNANADLGALQNNGGPTDTRALGANSAAIDAGTSASAPIVDQRGVQRPLGAYDIGAYELFSVTLTKVNGSTVTFPYLTKDDVSTVGGSCSEALGAVSVTVNGNPTAPATTTCTGGNWTLDLDPDLSDDGEFTFEASQVGATSSGGKKVTIDQTAPVVTLEKVNGAPRTFPYFTNQNVTSVGGSCTNGDGPVSVTLGGSPTAPATAACSAGSWTLTLTTPLSAENSYTFAASQTDAAGNTGGSGDKVVTIDKTAPVVTVTQVNGAPRTFPYFTNQNVTSVGGSCTNGDGDVSLKLGTDPTVPATATCSSGSWELTLTTPLSAEGSYTFAASQTDAATNTGSSGNRVVQIDKTGPTLTATAVKGEADDDFDPSEDYVEGSWTNQDVKVSFTCEDEQDGSGVAAGSPNPDTEIFDTEGEHTSSSTCSDNAGNPTNLDFAVKIDRTAPVISVLDVSPASPNGDNGWYTSAVTVRFTAEDEAAGLNDDCQTAFPEDEGINVQSKTTSEDGHAVRVESDSCTDVAGNKADPFKSAAFKIDTVDPSIDVSHTADGDNGWNKSDPVEVSVEVSDATSGVAGAPVCTVDDVDADVEAGDSEGAYKLSVTGEGSHQVECSVDDNAGRSNSDTDEVKIDTVDPSIDVSHTADGELGWNKSDPVEVSVEVSDATSGVAGAPACTVDDVDADVEAGDSEGAYKLSVTGEGTHQVECSVDDNAGRSNSDTDEVKIDTVNPSSKASSDDYETTSPFEVTYIRSDGGSGLAKVELWVKGPGASVYSLGPSDSGNDIDGSFMFTPGNEGTYSFYTIAVDKAGNREALPTDDDTQTFVEDDHTLFDATPPKTTADAGAYSFGDWTNANVTVSLSAADYLGTDPGGSGVDKTFYRVGSSGAFSEYTGAIELTTAGEHTVYYYSKDKAGNAEAENSVSVKIDKTAPTIDNLGPTPASPNGTNSWYTSPVTNKFKATDGGSGLDAACVAAFPADVPGEHVQSKTTSGQSSSVTVSSDGCSDVAGNSAASVNSAAFKIDLTDPSVAITSPTNGSSTTSSSITVSGTASDTPSGLASVTVGSQTGTSTVTVNNGQWTTTVNLECGPAPNTLTAMAKDVAGREKIHQIDVTRNCATGPAGLHARFLSPLDESIKSTTRIANKAKSGRVVPVQIELYSAGTTLSSADIAEGDITLQVTKMQTCDPSASEVVETYAAAGASNTGSAFRWSGTKMIYNLDTGNKAYSFVVNSCYRLNVLYKGTTLISWAPSPTAPATSISTAADWWAYLQIVK